MKSKWEPPKLIVIVRSEPEERALVPCKIDSGWEGPLLSYNTCAGGGEYSCSAVGTS